MKIIKPKFILSKKKVFEQIDILKEMFDEVSYSWKTNTDVGMVLSEKNVCHFSIISLNELRQFSLMTNNKNLIKRVWFFTLALNEQDLDILFNEFCVENFVVENKEDLDKLISYIDKNNKKINVLLRMKLRENTIFTGKHYVFGMKVKEVQEHILRLRKNKNIVKLGVHFHRKTQNVSEWNLKQEVAQSLGDEYLSQIDIMNLGGGLPGNYKNIHDKSLDGIFKKVNDLKEYISSYNIEMFIEPGRFVASPSVNLECQIISICNNTLFLNVSIFNGMLDTVVANVKLFVEGEFDQGKVRWLLKGCTPDSSDILRYSVYLENPEVGQKIIFLNCGAYNFNCNFCALDKIITKIIN